MHVDNSLPRRCSPRESAKRDSRATLNRRNIAHSKWLGPGNDAVIQDESVNPVVVIELPPLRERKQDIPALVDYFLRRGSRTISLTSNALNVLCDYHWPGNVRELEHAVERAAVLARAGVIDASDIQLKSVARAASNWTDQIPLSAGWKANLAAAEKAMLSRALRVAGGNKSRAAEILGMHRRLLYDKLREFEMGDVPG